MSRSDRVLADAEAVLRRHSERGKSLTSRARERRNASIMRRLGRIAGAAFAYAHDVASEADWERVITAAVADLGLAGYGQSSWGPTGFALVPSEAEARALVGMLERPGPLRFLIARGRNTGASVTAL